MLVVESPLGRLIPVPDDAYRYQEDQILLMLYRARMSARPHGVRLEHLLMATGLDPVTLQALLHRLLSNLLVTADSWSDRYTLSDRGVLHVQPYIERLGSR